VHASFSARCEILKISFRFSFSIRIDIEQSMVASVNSHLVLKGTSFRSEQEETVENEIRRKLSHG
jgi:hypothetical protein